MKHDLSIIRQFALRLVEDISPYCEKIEIAGSIRRSNPKCKDIELVLLPKSRSDRNKIGMYFLQNGRVAKGKFTGRYVKVVCSGFLVDVFIPQSHDYYRQLAIRTGPSEYSKKIAWAWEGKGYVGSERGLVEVSKQSDFVAPQSWESEKEFFEWLGMEYVEASGRF